MQSISVKEAEVSAVDVAYDEARAYLALDTNAKANSGWFKWIRRDRDSDSFFSRPNYGLTGFGTQVAILVAKAYVDCVEDAVGSAFGPTGTEVEQVRLCARTLDTTLKRSRAWVIERAKAPSFQDSLSELAERPSALPVRTAGRKPMTQRRCFVLALAKSLCMLTDDIPVKLIMVASLRGWQGTDDREVRRILTEEVKSSIKASVIAERASSTDSERTSNAVLARIQASTRPKASAQTDGRTDAGKLAAAMALVATLTDVTASTVMVDSLAGLAQEFGIEI
jgi:hypothetical protein